MPRATEIKHICASTEEHEIVRILAVETSERKKPPKGGMKPAQHIAVGW